MKFEEQFPELIITNEIIKKSQYGLGGMKKEIQKHCLDKQRVKEAIDKAFELGSIISRHETKLRLLKELGLDK